MSDPVLNAIDHFLEQWKRRYSQQSDPNLLLCRDCGAIVKHGWISMHDGLHHAIGYPVYPDVEEES